jgi:glycosyltransferase involved in cell wall biosynthesis
MTSSWLTVVIPTIREHADLLTRALVSVHAQTLPPEQVIVVRDKHRQGAAWARNQGLAKVPTPLVCFLDDDDELDPGHLEGLVPPLQDDDADLTYACVQVIGGRDPLATSYEGAWVDPCGIPFGPEQARHLRYQGNFIPIGWCANTELVQLVGGFPTSGGPGREEDYLLLLRLLNGGARFRHVPRRTYRYFIHGRNTGGGWRGTGGSNQEAFQP